MDVISHWQHQYFGLKRFPARITDLEREAFFTFKAEDLAEVRKLYTPNHRIAAAIQLGFLRMTGSTLDKIRVIPRDLLKHIGDQLGEEAPSIATLRTIYKHKRTRLYHQAWAMEKTGFKRANDKQLAKLKSHLLKESRYNGDVDQLVLAGKIWMYQRGFLNTGERPIRDIAVHAASQSEDGLYSIIRAEVPETTFKAWEKKVLTVRPELGITWLEWLGQSPRKGKRKGGIKARADRVEYLKELGVDQVPLKGVAIEKMRQYGAMVRRSRPAKFKTLAQHTRMLRLTCFLRYTLLECTDTAIAMFNRDAQALWREAWDKSKEMDQKKAVDLQVLVKQALNVLKDPMVDDATARRNAMDILEARSGEFPSRAAAARHLLTEPNSPVRSLLHQIQRLDLRHTMDSPASHAMTVIKGLYGTKHNALPDGFYKVRSAWKGLVDGEDRERALRAYEACTLQMVRRGLRSSTIYVDYSGAFKDRDELLIGKERWAKERASTYTNMGLPQSPTEFLDRLVASLRLKLAAMVKAVEAGELKIEDGRIKNHKLKALEHPAEWLKAASQLDRKIDRAQLPDVMLEVDSHAGVTRALLGRPARSEEELLKVYAGMLAHGTAMDATAISMMMPQVPPAVVLAGMQIFEDQAVVRAANEAVAAYHRRFPVAQAWGDGRLASADMMALDVSQRVWGARNDPRRGVPSIGTYSHFSDQWIIDYDQAIYLNERQAGAAIEGVIRQREIEIDQLAVDTHGYTDFAIALAKLLMFDLLPRLADIQERKLHLPNFIPPPDALKDVVGDRIAMKNIRTYWDDLVRVAASVQTGQVTAPIALSRFGSCADGDPVYKAGVALGKLIRTMFLCDYHIDENFQREINRILDHGEAVHKLQRAICTGTYTHTARGQRTEDRVAFSGSLTLLTNMCLAWTTSRIQAAVQPPGEKAMPDWIKIIGPVRYAHINFRGQFQFSIASYADRLFTEAPAKVVNIR